MTARRPADPARRDANPQAALVTSGLEMQQRGLELLFAEMQALAALLPGTDSRLPTDAEIEAEFDNLPV